MSFDRQQSDTSGAIKARIFDANDIAQDLNIIIEDFVTLIETDSLLANDNDVDRDTLTVTAVSATNAKGATLTLNTGGTISYDPTAAETFQALADSETLTDNIHPTLSVTAMAVKAQETWLVSKFSQRKGRSFPERPERTILWVRALRIGSATARSGYAPKAWPGLWRIVKAN